jgi:hypothetical protein
MGERKPEYLHEGEGRDIAEEVKEVDDPAHAPATGRGAGVIDTTKHDTPDEPDVHRDDRT